MSSGRIGGENSSYSGAGKRLARVDWCGCFSLLAQKVNSVFRYV